MKQLHIIKISKTDDFSQTNLFANNADLLELAKRTFN